MNNKLALAIGKTSDAEYFAKRGMSYRNVFDSSTGFMAPRTASGEFIAGLNPKWSGGQAGRDYYSECNGWVNTFIVQHDVGGLVQLLGGREEFVKRLDALFAEGYDGELKFVFLAQFPDSTGLIGQYPQGNEPAFHIPYLYCYAGAPWKTQSHVHQIMNSLYKNSSDGLIGNDDAGQMSAWYVMSALGFYPVTPGTPRYSIGTPHFDDVTVRSGGGKTLHIVARGAEEGKYYIRSVRLNGVLLHRNYLLHSEVIGGGELVFEMSDTPMLESSLGLQ